MLYLETLGIRNLISVLAKVACSGSVRGNDLALAPIGFGVHGYTGTGGDDFFALGGSMPLADDVPGSFARYAGSGESSRGWYPGDGGDTGGASANKPMPASTAVVAFG